MYIQKEVINMQGRVFLKVFGILMIIAGAISAILYIVVIAGAAQLGLGLLTAAGVIGVIAAVVELITGIIGVKNSAKPENAGKCLVWGIITLVLSVVSNVMVWIAGQTEAGSIIGTILTGFAVPVLFIIGAVLNKKSAAN